jgi:hypothetical protein
MEEAPENGKELLHSVRGNGMNEWMNDEVWVNSAVENILKNNCTVHKMCVGISYGWQALENECSSAPVSAGNMFQDLPGLLETAVNIEQYIQ